MQIIFLLLSGQLSVSFYHFYIVFLLLLISLLFLYWIFVCNIVRNTPYSFHFLFVSLPNRITKFVVSIQALVITAALYSLLHLFVSPAFQVHFCLILLPIGLVWKSFKFQSLDGLFYFAVSYFFKFLLVMHVKFIITNHFAILS